MNKGKGQRHEMTVLVVALGVLVAAVGLFVLRSRPATPPPPPAPVGTAEKAPEEPKPDNAKSPVGRDPFTGKAIAAQPRRVVIPPPAAAPGPRPGPTPGQRPQPGRDPKKAEITLVGVMGSTSPVAIIHKGNRRYYVKAGQKVSGYTVARVSADRAVLTQGTEQVVLLLHPPVEEED